MNAPAVGAGVGALRAHESARLHVSGRAPYTDDLPETEHTAHAAIGFSPAASGRIAKLDLSAVLTCPGVLRVFTARDIPGSNLHGIMTRDEPLLAGETVAYWGQPLFLVVARSHDAARRAARMANIEIAPLPAIFSASAAREQGLEVAPARTARSGDAEAALALVQVMSEGHIDIGGQEHFYLEGQIAYACPLEDERVLVHCATQHPSEVQQIVARTLGWPMSRVNVQCRRMGGAFGGKESQCYVFAALAALAAASLGRPVKLRPDRDDDFMITGKRHEFHIGWRVAADRDGFLTAASFDHLVRCGWSADYSAAVADRAVFHATNAYFVPHFHCTSFRARTNTQSATAFRGFGGPQGVLGMEVAMQDLALRLAVDPLDLRKRNLLTHGERARLHYGFVLEDNVLPEMVERLEASCDYRVRRLAVADFNRRHRWIRRGLALMPAVFGVGFGATFLNQAGALIQIYVDGTVSVNHGGTEMGQGLNTKIAQIVAHELGLGTADVFVTATDTAKVPNTVSTAASSGADLNGMAACNAARELRRRLAEVAAARWHCMPSNVPFSNGFVRSGDKAVTFADLCTHAFTMQVSLSATDYYRVPKVEYDYDAFKGRPFYYYTYGVACSEVSIDTLTGELKIERVDILQDAGRSLNPALDRGQVEGGFIQGMGWLTSEELVWRDDGYLLTHAPQTYKIPTSRDIPEDFRVSFFENENAEDTVHRSKAIGEPPLQLAVSVWLAIWDAVAAAGGYAKAPALRAPATPEAILNALDSVR
ncbi:MAG: xanthine dehydrogenase molybdopterin binding subunit [Variovorax sp.]|nr:xanthine dehydrogenase molybdopterin binding subunit [Variovorax sp.]